MDHPIPGTKADGIALPANIRLIRLVVVVAVTTVVGLIFPQTVRNRLGTGLCLPSRVSRRHRRAVINTNIETRQGFWKVQRSRENPAKTRKTGHIQIFIKCFPIRQGGWEREGSITFREIPHRKVHIVPQRKYGRAAVERN